MSARRSLASRSVLSPGIFAFVLLSVSLIAAAGMWAVNAGSGHAATDEAAADAALLADLEEAVQMLQEGKLQMLAHDFFPPDAAIELLRSRVRAGSRDPFHMLPEGVQDTLAAHLSAAARGKRTFNRNFTLVQIDYVIEAREIAPPSEPKNVPNLMAPPVGPMPGLGSDLKAALTQAVQLLKADRIEEFVRATYPPGELGVLTQQDGLERLVFRISQVSAMKDAMIRDLEAAVAAAGAVSGPTEEIAIPDTNSSPGAPRLLKFELVNGDWRFADTGAATRQLQQELVSQPIPGKIIPGTEGTLILHLDRDLQSWRLSTLPNLE